MQVVNRTSAEKREARREALRAQRKAEVTRQRRVRSAVISAAVIMALVLAGGVGYLIFTATRANSLVTAPGDVPADRAYYSLGAPDGSGQPVLELHIDFMCPFCGDFEQLHGQDLAEIVANEEATVHLYTRRFLDPKSTTGDYSSRAANALACVYDDDPDNLVVYQNLLFANQPSELSAGLDSAELFELSQQAGASAAVEECINGKTHQSWVRTVAEPGAAGRASTTPYVSINGAEFSEWGEAGSLREAVLGASTGETGASDDGK